MPVALRGVVFLPTLLGVCILDFPFRTCPLFLSECRLERGFLIDGRSSAGGGSLTCVADTKLVCDPTQTDRGRELCKATS